MSDLSSSMHVAASGLRAQSARMRIISENVANANSAGQTPGADPYRRRIAVFENELDRALGASKVELGETQFDTSDFRLTYQPGHPAANEDGYVKMPNVDSLVELMDMREAQRAYEANLNIIENTRAMLGRTLDLLRK